MKKVYSFAGSFRSLFVLCYKNRSKYGNTVIGIRGEGEGLENGFRGVEHGRGGRRLGTPRNGNHG